MLKGGTETIGNRLGRKRTREGSVCKTGLRQGAKRSVGVLVCGASFWRMDGWSVVCCSVQERGERRQDKTWSRYFAGWWKLNLGDFFENRKSTYLLRTELMSRKGLVVGW